MGAVEIKREGILFLLVGPAGSGKSTLCQRLLDEFPADLKYAVSATTRPPRENEVNGRSYFFLSEEEFQKKRDAGEFFETECNHGYWYGTYGSILHEGIEEGYDLAYQIDVRGALTFRRAYPQNSVMIFLVPPLFGELEKRIRGRGGAAEGEVETRLKTAISEYEILGDQTRNQGLIDYVIINDDLERAYHDLRSILIAERKRFARLKVKTFVEQCKGEGRV